MKLRSLTCFLYCLALFTIACSSADEPTNIEQTPSAADKQASASMTTETSTKPEPQAKPEPTAEAAAATEPAKPSLNPNTYDPAKPIPADMLHDAFYADKEAWLGKEVQVLGYYKGSTHSSATDRTRVDLKANATGKSLVGCLIPGKGVTPESAVKNRAGIIMKGTITQPFFGQVILDNAVFLNRE